MRLILLGAPGSGKGTQGARLAADLQIPTISTGELLRQAVTKNTALGVMARGFMSQGKLVPDDVIMGLIREVLDARTTDGFILDGFPRTIAQAEGLDELLGGYGLDLRFAIALDVAQEKVVKRLSARRVCSECRADANPQPDGSPATGPCGNCGGALIQREDDREETVRKRLMVYDEQTAPLLGYYAAQGKLTRIDGDRPVDVVFDDLLRLVRGDQA